VERVHYFFPPPGDLKVTYPYGQSVDMNLRVQVDSDSAMNGGVTPDIRVPLNDTVMDPLYIDSVDVELQYAVKTLSSILDSAIRRTKVLNRAWNRTTRIPSAAPQR